MLFPTTLVGSYPQPEWLIDRKKLAGRFPPRVRARELWRVEDSFLREAQDDATVLAIPAQRQDPPSEPEIRFMEAPANTPPAIRTWWYPGRTIGHEFIYPKSQARRLAARQTEPVLTVTGNGQSTDDMQKADLERVSASGDETVVTADAAPRDTAPPPAVERVPEPRPRTTADARREPRTELSRTASPMPLIGLTGVLALALVGALRLRRL